MINNDFLGKEPVGPLLLKMALPAITAQLINMLYNMVDRIYIGQIQDIGHLALTGIGVCLPITILVSAFAALISMGGAPKSAMAMGANDKDKAELILGNSLFTLILMSIILTIVFSVFKEDLLYFFGASVNTIEYSMDYIGIYLLGTIFVQISLGMNPFITAQGFAKISMLSILIGAISNIVLDPIFIFYFEMGTSGAALATIISQAISATWIIYFLKSSKSIIRIKLKNMIPQPKIIFSCMILGLASFIMQSTESLVMISFNTSLLKYGGDIAVGAMVILTSMMQLSMLPTQGLSQGAQPIIAYNYGACNSIRVKSTFKILVLCSFLFTATGWSLVMLVPETLIGVFTSNQQLIDYTITALRIYMAASLIFGIQVACQTTFVAISRPRESIFIALLRKVILLVPLIYILPAILPIQKDLAVFLAEPIADTISVTITIILFTIQFKKTLQLLRVEESMKAS